MGYTLAGVELVSTVALWLVDPGGYGRRSSQDPCLDTVEGLYRRLSASIILP